MCIKKLNVKITKEIIITVLFLIVILATMVSAFMKLFKVEEGAKFELSKKKIEIASADYIFFRMEYVKLWGLANKVTGKYLIEGKNVDIVRLKNGYLTHMYGKTDTEKFANAIKELNDFLTKKDIPLLYVLAPFKIDKTDTKLPLGIKDSVNMSTDEFMESLNKYNIENLDLRQEVKNDDLDHYSLFFKTDHHWKPEAGLWATEKIASVLNENYDFDIDLGLYNIKNYDVKTYEKWYLGSQGRKVSLGYIAPEDINMITPKFETSFRFTNFKNKEFSEGDFKEAILDYEHINIKDYYNDDPYSTYLRYLSNSSIENLNAKDDKKILFIKDSFAQVVIPFLALDVKNIDILAVQSYEGSIKEYIDRTDPDIVIFLYNPSQIRDPNFNIN